MSDEIKLPIKITPDPIIDSIVEFRFTPNIAQEKIIPELITILVKEFPSFHYNGVPSDLRTLPEFKFSAEARLSNEEFIVGIGNNVLFFSCNQTYKGWSKFSEIIAKSLEQVIKSKMIKVVDRIGVRYINFFANQKDISKNLNLEIDFHGKGNYKTLNTSFTTGLEKEGFSHFLRVSDNSLFNDNVGSVIDIDTSKSDGFTDFDDIVRTMNVAHKEEKVLFVRLLKEEFLKTLNPEYS